MGQAVEYGPGSVKIDPLLYLGPATAPIHLRSFTNPGSSSAASPPPPVRIRPSVVGWLRRARPCVRVPVSSAAWIRCVEPAVVFLAFGPQPGRQPSIGADRRSSASKAANRSGLSREGGSRWKAAVNGSGRSTEGGGPRKGGTSKGGSPGKEAVDRRGWPRAGGVQQAAVANKKKRKKAT